ncbi:MAG: phage protease [Verrucomicrobiota bacterium]
MKKTSRHEFCPRKALEGQFGINLPTTPHKRFCKRVERFCNGVLFRRPSAIFNSAPESGENRSFGPGSDLRNRENPGEDGWYHLVSKGEFPNRDTKGKHWVQVIDDSAIEAIAGDLPKPLDMLVDRDHLSHDLSQETRAAGWIKETEIREDGLWARIDWTPSGRADVEGREYRWLSPEFPSGGFESLGKNRIRPKKLSGAALTNRRGLTNLSPLMNRGHHNQPNHTPQMEDLLKRLRSFLGLGEDADEGALLNRLNETDQTLADLETAAGETADLRNRVTELSTELADATLSEYAEFISDPEKIRPSLIANREATLDFLKGLKKPEGEKKPADPVFNRKDAKAPDGPAEKLEKDAKTEEARAQRISNRAQTIMREERVGFHVAWGRAEAEEPAVES